MDSSNFISVPKEFKGVSKAGTRESSSETELSSCDQIEGKAGDVNGLRENRNKMI